MRADRAGAIPTVDLYFGFALADLVRHWPWQAGRPIVAVGRTAFRCGSHLVIIRYADGAAMRAAASAAEIHYLLDDDLWAIDMNAGLPEDYRARLMRFRERDLPRIVECATEVIAPTPAILAHLPGRRSAVLQPCLWPRALPAPGAAGRGPVRMILPATRSHLDDIRLVAAGIRAALESRPALGLTTFLGRHAPPELSGLPNVRHLPPRAWPAHRRRLERSRYDIALAPLRDTAFNRARSISKVLEIAQFGAAGIYSDCEPYAGAAGASGGLLLGPDPAAWTQAILDLAEDAPARLRLAQAGQALARRIGNPERVRRFWLERFGIEAGDRVRPSPPPPP
ncbi:hypothetical protein [Propylenella binzhouense]|uniref:Uncharacterized protein n=1 Tax=Propylenella binzhouense TaxID=2555902 RepID=A0A964T7E3_9HYPH|nr:hypothetical protein [Propylenella binzhouense]MYZ49815.1 hypothetical protein [Propylenella binzhouense]